MKQNYDQVWTKAKNVNRSLLYFHVELLYNLQILNDVTEKWQKRYFHYAELEFLYKYYY